MKYSITPYQTQLRVPMRSDALLNAAGLLFVLGLVVFVAEQS